MTNPDACLLDSSETSSLFRLNWSDLPICLKGLILIVLPMCSLLFVSVANGITDRKQTEADSEAKASIRAQDRAHDLLKVLLHADTAVRAYALTQDPVLLQPYERALANYPSLVQAIEQTSDGALAAAARNAFEAVKRAKSYAENRFPQIGGPGSTVLLLDEDASKAKFRLELAKFERDPSPFLEESRKRLLSMRRLSRAADILAAAVAIFGFILFMYLWRASEPPIQRARQLIAKNSDLARALAGAKEASEHKSRFLANMSHELRAPLNSIIGFTEIVYDKRAGELTETQEEFLGDSLRSARHLLALIDDILDLEKIAAGHLQLRPELFDLHHLIEETIHELRVAAATKNTSLSCELDELVRRVFLDRRKTKQILLNLVANALKFTPEGGRVGVRAQAAGIGRCVLEIEDTGVGISAEGQTRLFREFEQLESTSTNRLQGTGLGLALTKKLVEAQGGTITVTSQVDVGSTFRVMLPTALESRVQIAGTPAPGGFGKTVLPVGSEERRTSH
jgi:signal transduction histidine kinase